MLPLQDNPPISYMQSSSYVYDNVRKKFANKEPLEQDQKAQQFLDRFSQNKSESIEEGKINELKDTLIGVQIQSRIYRMFQQFGILQDDLAKIKERQLTYEQQQFILTILEKHKYVEIQSNKKFSLADILQEAMKKQGEKLKCSLPKKGFYNRKNHRYDQFQPCQQQQQMELIHQDEELKKESKAKRLKNYFEQHKSIEAKIDLEEDQNSFRYFEPLIFTIQKLERIYLQGRINMVQIQVFYTDVEKVIIRNKNVFLKILGLGQIKIEMSYCMAQLSLFALISRISITSKKV